MKIEKNVPVPQKSGSQRGGKTKYPWKDMVPGDSLFFETRKDGRAALSAANKFAKRNGGRFVSAKEQSGIRIWKLES